ncbi:sigma-70 family RNA polymerase sigma factor [Fulvivirgaceae bacterium BMA12]|uniref:Sigma-70 family RNA polymerase sigma factor n=1 Tax=Agaribacillus aureus TaxID=3051825 RepID=A0ABT8KY91_9BACT|nr:sigma-70 family RNA polymerase sigma factor [Fulvivirgaceae bacterium BMA12]
MDLNNVFSTDTISDLSALKESLNTSDLSDVQLWDMIRKEDTGAMVKLYKRHYHILYAYGVKVCQDKDLTKDSIQEVFTNIWASRARLSKVKKVRSYLLQSLWNKLMRELKKTSRTSDIYNNKVYQYEPVFSFEYQLIDREKSDEQLAKLDKSVSSLSKSQKEIIFMVFYEGLSYKEISERKSINYQSVKNLSHKAIKKLREMIIAVIIMIAYFFI